MRRGKKLTIENWILTTTCTARTFIILLLNRPFCNEFESLPFSLFYLSLFLTYLTLKKNLFFNFNEMRLTKERKQSTYYCVWVFLELDLQKICRFLRKIIFFFIDVCVCIPFHKMKMHSDIQLDKISRNTSSKLHFIKKNLMFTCIRIQWIIKKELHRLYEIPMLSYSLHITICNRLWNAWKRERERGIKIDANIK